MRKFSCYFVAPKTNWRSVCLQIGRRWSTAIYHTFVRLNRARKRSTNTFVTSSAKSNTETPAGQYHRSLSDNHHLGHYPRTIPLLEHPLFYLGALEIEAHLVCWPSVVKGNILMIVFQFFLCCILLHVLFYLCFLIYLLTFFNCAFTLRVIFPNYRLKSTF